MGDLKLRRRYDVTLWGPGYLETVEKVDAHGKRQWWSGCCGSDLLAGSDAPGMMSTGAVLANSVIAMSISLSNHAPSVSAQQIYGRLIAPPRVTHSR